MFSTNHRLIYTYTRRMLIREKQRVGLSIFSTSSKRRVSISPVYIWYMLTICIAQPDPAGRLRGVPFAVYPPLKGYAYFAYSLHIYS